MLLSNLTLEVDASFHDLANPSVEAPSVGEVVAGILQAVQDSLHLPDAGMKAVLDAYVNELPEWAPEVSPVPPPAVFTQDDLDDLARNVDRMLGVAFPQDVDASKCTAPKAASLPKKVTVGKRDSKEGITGG